MVFELANQGLKGRLPPCQGIRIYRVHLQSDLVRPFGSLAAGMPTDVIFRATSSFSTWYRADMPGARLQIQTKLWIQYASIKASQWHWRGAHRSKDDRYSDCCIVKPQAARWNRQRSIASLYYVERQLLLLLSPLLLLLLYVKKTVVYTRVNGASHIENCKNYNRNAYAIYQWCHFQWPWTNPNPVFKVTPLFGAKYLTNGYR